MKIEIKSWITGSILFEGDFSSIATALMAAVKNKTVLSGADLSGADLSDAAQGIGSNRWLASSL